LKAISRIYETGSFTASNCDFPLWDFSVKLSVLCG
jgi:hypothetical protein